MANVQFTFPRKDPRNDPLFSDLGQVRLVDPTFLLKASNGLGSEGVENGEMGFLGSCARASEMSEAEICLAWI